MKFNDFSAGVFLKATVVLAAIGCGTSSPSVTPPANDGGPDMKMPTDVPAASGGSGGNMGGAGGSGGSTAGSGGTDAAAPDGSGDTMVAMMPIPGTCQPPVDPD